MQFFFDAMMEKHTIKEAKMRNCHPPVQYVAASLQPEPHAL